MPLPKPDEVAAAANTPLETQMERSIREVKEHAELIERETAVAKKRGLCPIVRVDELVAGDYAVAQHYRCKDFALGGTGTSFYAINAQRPACGIRLFPALDTYRGHSSGVAGQFRRWQIVHPKEHLVPQGFRSPPSTRWIVVWIGMVVDEQATHLVEPIIFIAPFIPVSATKNKVAPFIIECGPGDFTAEQWVPPSHERNTHVNGFLSRLFGIYFEQWKLMALLRWFPCPPAPKAAPAPPETPAAVPASAAAPPLTTPPPPPSPQVQPPEPEARPPTFSRSATAASSYGFRKKSPLTKEQAALLKEAEDWRRRAEKAEAGWAALKKKNNLAKKAADRKKPAKAPKPERLPAKPALKYLEMHLEAWYENHTVKWFVSLPSPLII